MRLKRFDQKKEVRAIAREKIGIVRGSRVIVPKTQRKKTKHKGQENNNYGRGGRSPEAPIFP